MGPYYNKAHDQREKTIEEAQEAALVFCQDIASVLFRPYAPAFLSSVLLRGDEWTDLTAHVDTAHAASALTETATPNPATPAAVGSGKINSNRARPTDIQTASPSLPGDPDRDVTLVASIGGSDNNSDYVKLAKNSPMSPSNTPDLVGHIRKLEGMHKVAEGELDAIAQPTVLFFPHRRSQNSGARRCRDQPAGKPPRRWRHAAVQHSAFPSAFTPGIHPGSIIRASATPTRQGRRRRPSNARGRPPGRPP